MGHQSTMPRTVLTPPAGGSPMPDFPNWAWHEYGNRVGFWRMLEVLDRDKIRAILAVNGTAVHTYSPIARAAKARNWGLTGHGFTQRNMQKMENYAMMPIRHHPAREYFQRAMAQFDQLYHDAATGSARVMALVVHRYIMGAPHRLKYFRMIFERIRERSDVLFWAGEQMLEWYLKERPLQL